MRLSTYPLFVALFFFGVLGCDPNVPTVDDNNSNNPQNNSNNGSNNANNISRDMGSDLRVDVDTDGVPDAGDDSGSACETTDQLDLLIMVDNSNSMTEEQAAFAAELPRLISILATGDFDQDGTPDFSPIQSINVGVVTSDMGTNGVPFPTCGVSDDGVLITRGNTAIAGCNATYPNVQSYADDAVALAQSLSCVTTAGIGGCGWEQQMESVLKAVTPSTSTIMFQDGTGHADLANAGFLRPDAMLAFILLTDEDDCSVSDNEIFESNTAVYPGGLNVRCAMYPDAMYPARRYVDGLIATRDRPDLIFFSPIAGIPSGLLDGLRPDYQTILADPSMQNEFDQTGNSLVPSCDVVATGTAFPPRRLVEIGRELETAGATTVLGSICQEDLTRPIDRLLSAILRRAECAN